MPILELWPRLAHIESFELFDGGDNGDIGNLDALTDSPCCLNKILEAQCTKFLP